MELYQMTKINPIFQKKEKEEPSPIFTWLAPHPLWIFGNWGNEACFRQIPEQNQLWAGKPDKYILLYSFTKKTFSFKNKSLALQMKIVWIFDESSTKKQDVFCWKLYKSRMAFVESWKQDGFRSKPCESLSKNCDNTRVRDKIAFVGGPSFRGRPWPFVERR